MFPVGQPLSYINFCTNSPVRGLSRSFTHSSAVMISAGASTPLAAMVEAALIFIGRAVAAQVFVGPYVYDPAPLSAYVAFFTPIGESFSALQLSSARLTHRRTNV